MTSNNRKGLGIALGVVLLWGVGMVVAAVANKGISDMGSTSFALLCFAAVFLIIVGLASLYLAPRYREGIIGGFAQLIRMAFRAALALGAVFLVIAFVREYLESPHPRPRVVVQVGSEYIVTVKGISDDGWLTDCSTGYRRHITGNYTIIDDEKTPIVCVNERHYDEWVKSRSAASGGSKQ